MKLNKKGYMLAEIVIASVLAMGIAYYLLNLTYKFKNTNENIYQSHFYMQTKLLVTKNIMSDLERGNIVGFTKNSSSNSDELDFDFSITENDVIKYEKRKLIITKNIETTTIEYGKIDEHTKSFDKDDVSYYKKELSKTLIIGDLNVITESTGLTITLPARSIYDDRDYSIKLFVNYIVE